MRRIVGGYEEPSSHMSATTSPASLIPSIGYSLPNRLNVTLPYFEIHEVVVERVAVARSAGSIYSHDLPTGSTRKRLSVPVAGRYVDVANSRAVRV